MVDTKEEQLVKWKQKIKLGILYQSHYAHTERWPRFERYFEGDWGRGILPVNLIFAFGKSLLPNIYNRNPRAILSPMGPGKALHTKATERVLNYLIYETNVKKQIKRMCQDSYIYGTAVGKCGYDSEYGYARDKSIPLVPGEGTLTGFGDEEENIEYRVDVKPGMPWFLRDKPSNFVLPYGYIDIDASPWCASRVMRPLEDVAVDTKYINKGNLKGGRTFKERNIKATMQTDTEGAVKDRMFETVCEKEDWVELWEIRDFRSRKVYTVSMDHDKFLREDVDELQIEGLPYISLIFNDSGFGFWGISDCQIIEPQQLELNEIRTQAQAHRRVALIKAMLARNAMTQAEKDKFLSGDVMPLIELDIPPGSSITDVIMLLTPHVPPDFVALTTQIMEDVMQMLGSSRNQRGDYNLGRRTATEAQIVQLAAQVRLNERRDATADLFTLICRKYLQYIFTFWRDKTQVIDIIGQDGARYWIEYTGAAIKGEYNIKVNPDDSLPVTFETRRQEARELYTLTAQDPTINRVEMSRQLLNQYDWIDSDLLLAPRPGWGNNPEQAVPINALQRMLQQQGGPQGA